METQTVAGFLADKFNEHVAMQSWPAGMSVPPVEYVTAELIHIEVPVSRGRARSRFMLMVGAMVEMQRHTQ